MLTESMEDYLEMVCRLVDKKGYVRAVDLSEALQFQASSITKMIQKLDEAGFISYEKYRNIALTPLGLKYGRFLIWRDATLKKFFRMLNAPEAGIEEQVEGIEHYITPDTMGVISKLISFFERNPEALAAFHTGPETGLEESDSLDRLRAFEFRHNTE
jgi:Mn-dependent DtxR family transcriptional regulator